MTNAKATKRALLSSALALFLCCAMLIGTTFAWFTDSVTSENNIIKSGNLDITLEYWNGTKWADVQDKEDILTNDLWEPGVTEVAYFRIKNAGSLALKYQFGINIVSETAGVNVAGKEFLLSDYIYFDIVEGQEPEFADRDAAMAYATETTKISAGYAKAGTLLAESDYVYLAMVVYMPTTVGNEANHNGINVPQINLGINIMATQVASEEDSFGPDYDFDAPIVSAPIARPDSAVTLKGAEDVKITLSKDLINALPAEVTEIGMLVSEPKVVDNTIVFDSIELVDQNGDVIDLESLALAEKITVTLPAQTTFAVGETVMIYHDGEFVAAAVVGANGVISYDVEHLCEVTVGAVEAPVVKDNNIVEISTAAQLFGLAQEVNSGNNYYAGKTVVLTKDIDLKDAEWTPIGSATMEHGFMGNFDGKGYTISNLSIKNIALDADGYAYAGFFGVTEGTDKDNQNYIKNLKIENVTINTEGHIVAAAIAYPYYTVLENITVCGDIAIKGGDYTSGVLAYTRRCVDASNIAINGNKGSYITGRNTVGGVISDIQMNGGLTANYSNFSASNLTITGNQCVGGISGIIGGQTLDGATVENVKLVCSDAHVGVVSGSYDSKPVIKNVTATNVTGATAVAGAPYSTDSNAYVVIDGVEYVGTLAEIKNMLAAGETTIRFACDINGDLTIVQAPDVKITIDGMGNRFNGVITVDGKSGTYTTAGLTIKNVNFQAESISADACIRLGDGTNATRYTCNVTVENCTFDVPGAVGVKSYTGGDKNLTIKNSTATAKAHSLVQAKGIDGILVEKCVVNSKNGLNFNNSTNVTVDGCTVDVKGYAVRFGESSGGSGAAETYIIENSTLKSANDDGDATIILRGTADNSTLTITKTTIEGAVKFANTAANATVIVDGATVVCNADQLVAALEAKKDVLFGCNIKVDPANMSNAYGKTGINVKYGQTIDGNGYTLDIRGAGGTWDSGINTTGGIIKNITVTGSFRGIFINHTSDYSEKVVLENVVIGGNGTVYTISCDQGLYQGIEATNCTFNGWTSFAKTVGEAKFVDCTFGEGIGYAFCRPYAPTEFIGCTFSEGYTVDQSKTTVTFENCNYNK